MVDYVSRLREYFLFHFSLLFPFPLFEIYIPFLFALVSRYRCGHTMGPKGCFVVTEKRNKENTPQGPKQSGDVAPHDLPLGYIQPCIPQNHTSYSCQQRHDGFYLNGLFC